MLNHQELMQSHIEALFTHDAAGDLLRVNEPDGASAPRFFLGRTPHGAVLRYRHDVDHGSRAMLEAAARDDLRVARVFDAPLDPSRYADVLARSATVQRVEAGPAFCCPLELPAGPETTRVTETNAHILQAHLPEWISVVPCWQPMFALTVDGQAVSLCCSVRLTARAHEAGVETAPDYRGRGYVGYVVAAWARAVRAQHRVPLYSTSWTNEASRAVARKLGLFLFGSDLHLT
ncbi:MAG TPA: GNAT family N-acetyltransferase [Gemmatimonadaceae bacterium]|nr:GNAT family N-acetyltransferase [Gemmatimonadaceae bacterium]